MQSDTKTYDQGISGRDRLNGDGQIKTVDK